jgi:PAS domain S-box-containing protein
MSDHNIPEAVRAALDISPSYYAIADFNGRLTFLNYALQKCCQTQYGNNNNPKHVDDLELTSFYLHKRLFWSDIVDTCSQDTINLQVSIGEKAGVFRLTAGIIEGRLSKNILLCFVEITPKHELEVQLLEKNGFMDQFLNELPQMICSIDEKGLIRFWNKQCEEMSGYSASEVLQNGNAFSLLFPNPRHNEQIMDKLLRKENGVLRHINTELTTKDGLTKMIAWNIVFKENPSIQGLSYWLTGTDVTAMHRAMNVLIESEKRFSIISKASNDAVWDWDLETDELWWNEGLSSIFGYNQDEIENTYKWWLERLHPSFTDQVNEKLKDHVDQGKELWSDEYMFRKKDGSYAYVFHKGYIIKNEKGKPIRFIGGMVDITHVKENSDLE